MKKKPIYLYILLFFSTVGTLTSAVSTFGASKSFELTDDFAKQLGLTTAQDKADYQQLHGTGLGLFFAQLGVVAQVFNDLVAHGHGGVQGRQRVLEHHGHLAAAVGAEALFVELEHILAVKDNFTALFDLSGRRFDQPHDALGRNRLAAAGLTHNGHRLALVYRKAVFIQNVLMPSCPCNNAEISNPL